MAAISSDASLLFGASFNLPGQVQTVPRGELYALVTLIDFVQPGSTIDYVTDNKGLYDTYQRGPQYALRTTNCDLYKEVYDVMYKKALLVEVRWVPSHLLQQPQKGVYNCMSNLDIQGNAQADELAGQAARKFTVPLNVSSKYLYYINLTKRIQLRLATILTNLPDRPKIRRHVTKEHTLKLPEVSTLRHMSSLI